MKERRNLTVSAPLHAKLSEEPGATWDEKLEGLRVKAAGVPGGASQKPSDNGASSPTSVEPTNEKIEPGPETAFDTLPDKCAMMDLENLRCLRNGPARVFKIDRQICEACQFRGEHFPPNLNGVTPKEMDRRTFTERVAETRLEAEKLKTDRQPVKVYY